MHLHEKGQKDYIKELKKQRSIELKKVLNSEAAEERKESLINKIIKKFAKLIKDTDESLFVKGT